MNGPVTLRQRWYCEGTAAASHAPVYFDEQGHCEPLWCPVCNRIETAKNGRESADSRGIALEKAEVAATIKTAVNIIRATYACDDEWATEVLDDVYEALNSDRECLRHPQAALDVLSAALREASRQLPAATVHHGHRVCTNEEHDPTHGKLSGYCVVCGTSWPCETEQRWIAGVFAQQEVEPWTPCPDCGWCTDPPRGDRPGKCPICSEEKRAEAAEATFIAANGCAWLIWSHEHGAWWGPNRCGYTMNPAAAGRYPMREAVEICALRSTRTRSDDAPNEVIVASPEIIKSLMGNRA